MAARLLLLSLEEHMAIVHLNASASRIEVSGWDKNEDFFVEQSEFAYDDVSGKHITLAHNLPEGSLIFLRLIDSTSSHHSVPVAYHAKFIRFDSDGHHQFRLVPAHPLQPVSLFPVN
jgi:hypothetical protein